MTSLETRIAEADKHRELAVFSKEDVRKRYSKARTFLTEAIRSNNITNYYEAISLVDSTDKLLEAAAIFCEVTDKIYWDLRIGGK